MNYIKRVLFGACILVGSVAFAEENDLLLVSLTFANWDECERVRQQIAKEFESEFDYGVPKGTMEYAFALKLVGDVKERLAKQQWLKQVREGSILECKRAHVQKVGE